MDLHSCRGVDCSIFALDGHLFAARTQDERILWLRAAGNIKVKLMFDAPDPTKQEMMAFRSEVTGDLEAEDTKQLALLPVKPRMPVQSPRGDVWAAVLPDDVSEMCSRSHSRAASRV